jgi:hypothetical protein
MVSEKLAEKYLKRVLHSTYRPDLSSCDFFPFLFGYLKDKLIDKQ